MAPRPHPWTTTQVHRWHRRLRQERLERKAAGVEGPPTPVRDLERRLGRLRDLDLLIDLLTEPRGAPEGAGEREWRRRTREDLLRRRRRTARSLPLPPRGLRTAPRAHVDLAPALRRLDRDIARALERDTAGRVHAVRQSIRRVEAACTVAAAPGTRYERSRPVGRLMSALGRVHDLDRSIEQLSTMTSTEPREAWITTLSSRRRDLMQTARRRLRRREAVRLFRDR